MICNNTNNSVRNNQAFLQESLNVYYMLGATMPASYEPVDGLVRLSKYTIALFKELVRRHVFDDHVFPSHFLLAKKLKCNPRTIQRAQKELEIYGIIKVFSGKKKHQTNLYSLGDILFNSDAFYYLRNVVPCLRFVIRRLLGYMGTDILIPTVENQNVGRINKVLKVSDTKSNTIVKSEDKAPKKYNHFQQSKYKLQAERWKKESEGQKIEKERVTKDAASIKWRNAVAESRPVLRTDQDIAKIQSALQEAAKTITGTAASFLKYLL